MLYFSTISTTQKNNNLLVKSEIIDIYRLSKPLFLLSAIVFRNLIHSVYYFVVEWTIPHILRALQLTDCLVLRI